MTHLTLKKKGMSLYLSGPDDAVALERDLLKTRGWLLQIKQHVPEISTFSKDYFHQTELMRWLQGQGITIPQEEFNNWRMLPRDEQRVGQINGLEDSRGFLRCTNGSLCYIERATLPPLLGHIEFFIPDPVENAKQPRPKVKEATETQKKPQKAKLWHDKAMESLEWI